MATETKGELRAQIVDLIERVDALERKNEELRKTNRRLGREKAQAPSIRKRSGDVVSSNDSLIAFLYVLLRDELPAGKVEALMRDVEKPPKGTRVLEYSNGWLARHAMDLAQRLRGKEKKS